MFIGNIILWLPFRAEPFISNNIFFTLAVNLSLINETEKKDKNIFLLIIFIFLTLIAEGSLLATILIMVFHHLKYDKKKMSLVYIVISLFLIPNIQWMQFLLCLLY